MRPTLRGAAVAAVVVTGIAMSVAFGARSLNAVVVPALVALGAGAFQLSRATPPEVSRTRPDPGFPGDTQPAHLLVEASIPCRVTDGTDDGGALVLRGADGEVPGDGTLAAIEYEVDYRRRGEHALGPAVASGTDVLGLFRREFEYDARTPVLVYPTVHRLGTRGGLADIAERVVTPERSAFDHLREYDPGDPLRDVDWKSSAKRPGEDLVVAEYDAIDEGTVEVVAETEHADGSEGGDRAADAMAEATASVVTFLLRAGAPVALSAPGERVPEGTGPPQQESALELLARVRGGRVSSEARHAADVHVVGTPDGATVTIDGRTVSFESLRSESSDAHLGSEWERPDSDEEVAPRA